MLSPAWSGPVVFNYFRRWTNPRWIDANIATASERLFWFWFEIKNSAGHQKNVWVWVAFVRAMDWLTEEHSRWTTRTTPRPLFGYSVVFLAFANSVNFVESVNETRLEHLHVDIGFQSNDFGGQGTGAHGIWIWNSICDVLCIYWCWEGGPGVCGFCFDLCLILNEMLALCCFICHE